MKTLKTMICAAVLSFLVTVSGCGRTKNSGRDLMADDPHTTFRFANVFLETGNFRKAAENFEKAGNIYSEKGDAESVARSMLGLAQALYELGEYRRASEVVQKAEFVAEKLPDRKQAALITAELGNILIFAGDEKKGIDLLKKSGVFFDDKIKGKADTTAAARSFFLAASLKISVDDYSAAASDYALSAEAAEKTGNSSFAARARINAAKACYLTNDFSGSLELINKTEVSVYKLEDNHEKALLLVSISDLFARLCSDPDSPDRQKNMSRAFYAAEKAFIISEKNGDFAGQSLALGSMGRARELSGDLPGALDLTMKAILKASSVDFDPGLMKFHWQAGRILGKTGSIDQAIDSSREAVYHLERTRPEMSVECRSNPLVFKEVIWPVYTELVSLLLKRADSRADTDPDRCKDLDEVILTVEKIKTEEIKNYFRDDCVASMKSSIMESLHQLEKTAVIYPLIMQDELVILVKSGKKTRHFRSRVSSQELSSISDKLRDRLGDPGNRYYLKDSVKLYDLLIRPLEKTLEDEKIETIIFVPDGALRSIPLAALNDGNNFLVEKYAVGTTPGLVLTARQPLEKDAPGLLAAGLTDAVQGFPGLPGVSGELDIMESMFDARPLKNRAFSETNMGRALEQAPYSILHIASHGVFDRDPDRTFILTYEGRMNMKGLGRLITNPGIKVPVDMITLSACETAAGDDRSALGLAGVALRSGAKSALASLWFVDDDATSKLIIGFYENIKTRRSNSKAKALREAQITLIKDEKYRHPAFWAPFILIGNWL